MAVFIHPCSLFAVPSSSLQAVDRAGYKKPSPIQMAAIPLGLQFRDVIGIAGAWSCCRMAPAAYVLLSSLQLLHGMAPAPGASAASE